MNPFLMLLKSVGSLATKAVTGLLKHGKGFLKSLKNGVKPKKLLESGKNYAKKMKIKDGDTPSIIDVAKKEMSNKIDKSLSNFKESFKFKSIVTRIQDKALDSLGKTFGADYKAIAEKHKLTNKLREQGVPLSTIMQIEKDGGLNKDRLRSTYNELSNKLKLESKDKNKKLKLVQKLDEEYADIYREKLSERSDASEPLSSEYVNTDSFARDLDNLDKSYTTTVNKIIANDSIDKHTKDKLLNDESIKYNKKKQLILDKKNGIETRNSLNIVNEKLKNAVLKSLTENAELSDEQLNNGINHINRLVTELDAASGDQLDSRFQGLGEYITEENLINSDSLEQIKNLSATLANTTIDAIDNDHNNLMESLGKIQDQVIEDSVLSLEKSRDADKVLLDAINNIVVSQDEKDAEIQKNKDIEQAKLDANKSETDKLADLGTFNVMKSQSTILDMLANTKKSGKEIGEVMTQSINAALKSLGEDVGFWGTGIALAFDKIPDMIKSGLSFITEPLNKLNIPNPIHYLGKAFSSMLPDESKPAFSQRHPTISKMPGIGWIAEKMDGLGDWFGNKFGSLGNWMLDQAPESNIGLGEAISSAVTFIPSKLGDLLSYSMLKLMGLPEDLLDSDTRKNENVKILRTSDAAGNKSTKLSTSSQTTKITSSVIDDTVDTLAGTSPKTQDKSTPNDSIKSPIDASKVPSGTNEYSKLVPPANYLDSGISEITNVTLLDNLIVRESKSLNDAIRNGEPTEVHEDVIKSIKYRIYELSQLKSINGLKNAAVDVEIPEVPTKSDDTNLESKTDSVDKVTEVTNDLGKTDLTNKVTEVTEELVDKVTEIPESDIEVAKESINLDPQLVKSDITNESIPNELTSSIDAKNTIQELTEIIKSESKIINEITDEESLKYHEEILDSAKGKVTELIKTLPAEVVIDSTNDKVSDLNTELIEVAESNSNSKVVEESIDTKPVAKTPESPNVIIQPMQHTYTSKETRVIDNSDAVFPVGEGI